MEKLQKIVSLWRGGNLPKKRKTRVIQAYMTKFCISKPTADNTLNGRRTTPVDPEEVEFLVKQINNEIKYLKTVVTP